MYDEPAGNLPNESHVLLNNGFLSSSSKPEISKF